MFYVTWRLWKLILLLDNKSNLFIIKQNPAAICSRLIHRLLITCRISLNNDFYDCLSGFILGVSKSLSQTKAETQKHTDTWELFSSFTDNQQTSKRTTLGLWPEQLTLTHEAKSRHRKWFRGQDRDTTLSGTESWSVWEKRRARMVRVQAKVMLPGSKQGRVQKQRLVDPGEQVTQGQKRVPKQGGEGSRQDLKSASKNKMECWRVMKKL